MADKDILQSVYPHIGGQENISRTIPRKDILYVMLKDAGAVDLEAVRQTEGIEAAELERGRLALHLAGQEEKENTMAQDYKELVNSIVPLVGGAENIGAFRHCITRLRFEVKDKNRVDLEKIGQLPGCMGTKWAGQQLQVVIGPDVAQVYEMICAQTGIQGKGVENEEEDALKVPVKKDFKYYFNAVADALSACIVPMMYPMIGAGLVKVLLVLLTTFGVMTTEDMTYQVLYFAADAAFYFMPIFVGAAAAKKFGADQSLAMFLCAVMISPTFVANVSAGTAMSVFGIPVYMGSYASSIFPSIMTVFVMSYIQKFVEKHTPAPIRSMCAAFVTTIIMIPLVLCVIAPLGSILGQYLTAALMWFYNKAGFVAVAVFAFVYPLMVITGMHGAIVPVIFNTYAALGYEPFIWLAAIVSNTNQGVAALGVALNAKDEHTKGDAVSAAITAIVAGVTEPAMFGINMGHKKALFSSLIGNAAGGLVIGLTHCVTYQIIASGTFFCIPGYIGENSMNVFYMILAVLVGAVVTFAATMLAYRAGKEKN